MSKPYEVSFVISQLAKYRTRNDIIRDLCEQGGYLWEEAAALVHQVESEQAQQIQARRRPILMLLGVLHLLGGLGLMGFGVYSLLSGEQVPLTVIVYFIEIDLLPNGGQAVPFLLGLSILLGGAVGIRGACQWAGTPTHIII